MVRRRSAALAASFLVTGCGGHGASPRTAEVHIAPLSTATPLQKEKRTEPVDPEALFREVLSTAEEACRHKIIDTSSFAEGGSETTWCFDGELHLRWIKSASGEGAQTESGTYVFDRDVLRCGRESNEVVETTYCVGGEGGPVSSGSVTDEGRKAILQHARRAVSELRIPEPDESESCSRQEELEPEEPGAESATVLTRYIGVPVELCTRLPELTRRLEALVIPR